MTSTTRYRVEISVYYSFGSVYSTHLEASTKKELKKKMAEFVTQYTKHEVEVISFYSVHKTTITPVTDMPDKRFKLVKKVTNEYIKHSYK